MSIALAPATTLRTPSANMACARIVDVLVPSPTMSPVFSAAWRSIRAPRFSSGSLRSNSLAMVTPSLQTIGAPHFFSISTDLDFGPKRDADRIGELRRPTQDFLASRGAEEDLFVCHGITPIKEVATGSLMTPRARGEIYPGSRRNPSWQLLTMKSNSSPGCPTSHPTGSTSLNSGGWRGRTHP